MFTDEREDTLREVASLGNMKAVLHFCHSGVNINAQHKVNGWTALHWAAHRGHTEVVMALLKSGADPSLLTGKGQTALDLAVHHAPCAELLTQAMGNEATIRAEPEPQLPIQPTYMKNPDLEKTWLMPDEFTENKFENVLKKQQTQEIINPPAPQNQSTGQEEKEILVYLSGRLDDALLGSVYLSNQTIESAIDVIKQEIDGLPTRFGLVRHNGKVSIPINPKQMNKLLFELFRSEEDVLVIVPLPPID